MPGARRGPLTPHSAALAALAGFAALSMAACSLGNYVAQSATSEEELPTAVFSDYTHTVVERSKPMLEMKASRAEFYESSKRTVLTGVTFAEYDPDNGELVSRGEADEAVYHTDTKDAEFSGSVRLESKRQDAVLQGEFLRWIDKDKRLEGRLDRTVTIGRSDGSSVSGAGFEASARRRSFAFRGSVEGRIATKPEADK